MGKEGFSRSRGLGGRGQHQGPGTSQGCFQPKPRVAAGPPASLPGGASRFRGAGPSAQRNPARRSPGPGSRRLSQLPTGQSSPEHGCVAQGKAARSGETSVPANPGRRVTGCSLSGYRVSGTQRKVLTLRSWILQASSGVETDTGVPGREPHADPVLNKGSS